MRIEMNESESFQRILVGANGTPESEHAVNVAISLAKSLHARVTVLGVIAPFSPETQAEGVGLEEASKGRERMEEQLRKATACGENLRIDLQTEIIEGDPEKEIEEKAERDATDLIVVGHRDIGRVRRWLEGSTSETLVRTSRASVLVVHDEHPQK
jgi:nucleotide-binding universal stress UspA family protein